MKTAKQIREMMKIEPKSKDINRVLKILENDIIESAKNGNTEEDIYILQHVCPKNLVPAVVEKLRENGYTVKTAIIDDPRDGDCVKFNVKWSTLGLSR